MVQWNACDPLSLTAKIHLKLDTGLLNIAYNKADVGYNNCNICYKWQQIITQINTIDMMCHSCATEYFRKQIEIKALSFVQSAIKASEQYGRFSLMEKSAKWMRMMLTLSRVFSGIDQLGVE